jgi:hypothetical protein
VIYVVLLDPYMSSGPATPYTLEPRERANTMMFATWLVSLTSDRSSTSGPTLRMRPSVSAMLSRCYNMYVVEK